MSKYSVEYLSQQVVVGMMDDFDVAQQLWYPSDNVFPGFVPMEAVNELIGWDTVCIPVGINVPGEGWREEIEYVAVVRDDTYQLIGRSIHTDKYVDHGPKSKLLNKIEPLLCADLGIQSAGQLGGMAWVQLTMLDSIELGIGITFRPNLVLGTSFDGSLKTHGRESNRVNLCDNTFDADFRANKESAVFVKHTKASEDDEAWFSYNEAIETITMSGERFAASCEALCAEVCDDGTFRKVVDFLVPMPEDGNKRGTTVADDKRLDLFKLWTNDNRVSPWRGTTFGAVQAFNTWAQHEAQVRKGVDRFARNMSNFVSGKSQANDKLVLDTVRAVLADA